GTFVVRRPGSQKEFCAALLRKLPFQTKVVLCHERFFMPLETDNPFETKPSPPDVVRFVSILSKKARVQAQLPIKLPSGGNWLVRLIGSRGQFVFGEYRRHMKTITYLGQIDKLYGVLATTRNWNTILTILAILKDEKSRGAEY